MGRATIAKIQPHKLTQRHYTRISPAIQFQHPNVFIVKNKSTQNITSGDVRKNFPLPGSYMFRFKTSFKKTYVWKDATDDASKVPCHEGKIVAKVSRLRSSNSSSLPRETSTGSGAGSRAPARRSASAATRSQNTRQADPPSSTTTLLDLESDSSRPKNRSEGSASDASADSQRRNSNSSQGKERRYSDLLNMDDLDDSTAGAPSSSAASDASSSNKGSPVQDNDLMGLGDLDFSAPTAPQQGMRPPASSFGGSRMDALDPVQMRRASSANSAGPGGLSGLNINTASQGLRRAGSGGKARRDSPRSAALKGLMSDLSGMGSL